jgi:hypothetical protein
MPRGTAFFHTTGEKSGLVARPPRYSHCPGSRDRDGALPTRFGRISGSGHAGRPFAACGLIGTASAVASIGTRLPGHRVVAALPEQPIPACSSLQDIVSRTSEQLVVAAIAVQLIATRTTANDIVAAEAEDRVVSGQAMDDIIARRPEDRVAVTVPDDDRQSVT